jgi:phosphoribosylformylglycinamidine synthase
MAAAGSPGEDARLFDAVRAVGTELCPALGIAIPVGKDSMSMRTTWKEQVVEKSVAAPISLIVSAFAPVRDVRRSATPQLRNDRGEAELLFVDLGRGMNRLGGSCLAQAYARVGRTPPDVDGAEPLKGFFHAVQQLLAGGDLLAYHDRSDGGLIVTLLEMAFAGGCGLEVDLATIGGEDVAVLFAEELGAVLQVRARAVDGVTGAFAVAGLGGAVHRIGKAVPGDRILVKRGARILVDEERCTLRSAWSETTFCMQSLRDDPPCASEEHALRCDPRDPGLSPALTFDPNDDVAAPFIARGARPRVAIFREQGVNGQIEMAAAFDRAGFEAVDVHMTDLFTGRIDLATMKGLVACGGFSYGDVLGAGQGWAKSILNHAEVSEMFRRFFERRDTFSLGVCNG